MYVGTAEKAVRLKFHPVKSKTSRCLGYKTAVTITQTLFISSG